MFNPIPGPERRSSDRHARESSETASLCSTSGVSPGALPQSLPAERHAPDRLLTVREVAERLQISISWVYQHSDGQRRPHLKSIKVGNLVRFRGPDIEAFIEALVRQEGDK